MALYKRVHGDCDGCGEGANDELIGVDTYGEAERILRALHWSSRKDELLCPDCRTGTKEAPLTERLPRFQVQLVRETGPRTWDPLQIRDPRDTAALLSPWYATLDREAFVTLMVDTKHRIIGMNVVSIGDLSGTLVHPREVFKPIILANAAAAILSHNHPSGDTKPSPDDIDLTQRIVAAGRLLGIQILDHIIIGGDDYMSMRAERLAGF